MIQKKFGNGMRNILSRRHALLRHALLRHALLRHALLRHTRAMFTRDVALP